MRKIWSRHPAIKKIFSWGKLILTTSSWRSQINIRTKQWTTVAELATELLLKEVYSTQHKSSKQLLIRQILHKKFNIKRKKVSCWNKEQTMGPSYRSQNLAHLTFNIWKDKPSRNIRRWVSPKSMQISTRKRKTLIQILLVVSRWPRIVN